MSDITFSDSDEVDEDVICGEVRVRVQETTDSIFRAFKAFLSEPTFINASGDPTTNIVDRHARKCYNIPTKKISKFFKFINACRCRKMRMLFYEKQQDYSGIMIDFDIFQGHGSSQIKKCHYSRLCVSVVKLLSKYIDGLSDDVIVAFTKKPKVIYDDVKDYYKDGIHMIIPGVKIQKPVKKLILDELIDKHITQIFRDIKPHEKYTVDDFVDKMSSSVPVHFIGCSTKVNSPAYNLVHTFKIPVSSYAEEIIPEEVKMHLEETFNACYELSINWQKNPEKGGFIRKRKYSIKPQYAELISSYNNTNQIDENFDDVSNTNYNDLSLLNIHDPDAKYIMSLLDILHPKRAEDYKLWFNVLSVIANISKSYKPLAENFSRKHADKFDKASFDKTWDSVVKGNKKLTVGSLHFWAKQDNPDRYEEVKHRSIFDMLYKMVYDIQIEGQLGHYDIAKLLYRTLKDKYVYDQRDGGTKGVWFEFVLSGEPQRDGESFKWREYMGKPKSLLRYISDILPTLFQKVLDRLKTTYESCSEDHFKYHFKIYKAFQSTCRQLKNSAFKNGIMIESEQLFEQIGFTDKLDLDPDIIGVGDGILHLGNDVKFIDGYHGYYISKYTKTRYKEFNPYDPITKKLIIAMRNLFPDNEPDTFNFIMHYLASTLDGRKKESIMLFLVGAGSNGKSFLVELHKGALGSEYGVKMPISFLVSKAKDSESATPALIQLKNAHFAYYSESNKCEVLNVAKIKEFTGQETLAGRRLNENMINFKPKCHHMVTSNNDFEIPGSDHGTWRRLKYIQMKIKFCNPAVDEYDPENPYERIGDPTLGTDWTEDAEVLSRYLGLLVYFYKSLMSKYNGKVLNVPHPSIKKSTEEFRNRQDILNNFICSNIVKTNSDILTPIKQVIDKYQEWYAVRDPDTRHIIKGIINQIENSKLQKIIKKTRRGMFLIGHRVLEINEAKADDESYFGDDSGYDQKAEYSNNWENSIEFYNRICRGYDYQNKERKNDKEHKGINLTYEADNDEDSDESDIEGDIQEIKRTEPRDTHQVIPDQTFDENGLNKSTDTRQMESVKRNAAFLNISDSDSE
jgi:phage/plasmid-associated DNA primase